MYAFAVGTVLQKTSGHVYATSEAETTAYLPHLQSDTALFIYCMNIPAHLSGEPQTSFTPHASNELGHQWCTYRSSMGCGGRQARSSLAEVLT